MGLILFWLVSYEDVHAQFLVVLPAILEEESN